MMPRLTFDEVVQLVGTLIAGVAVFYAVLWIIP